MSLNWDLTKIKDYEKVKTDQEWPVTDAIIWYTWLCGVELTNEANAEKLYRRISKLEQQDGSRLVNSKTGEPSYITLADVQRRIGLNTNGGTKTEAEFNGYLKRRASRSFN